MRRSLLLIFVGLLLVQGGCIRERTSGDTLVLQMKWWTLLWAFAVPIAFGAIMFAKHPSIWVNGKWQPWWKFRGWDAREIGFAVTFLVVLPLMGVATQFDRLEVTPDYIRETSLSPFRGTRRIAFSDIQRIELPPSEDEKGFFRSLQPRKKKRPPAMRIVLKNTHQEDFNGQLVRQAQSQILDSARKSGVLIVNASPRQSADAVARPAPAGQRLNANPRHQPPDFDPFENAQPRFERVAPK